MSGEQCVRQTANGLVEGIEQTSSLGQKYYAFKGIPYAEPPITGVDPYTGERVDRRFKAPVPLKRTWREILKVQAYGHNCVPSSMNHKSSNPSEDCLFLNVYVPAGGSKDKTVLVWIHGGAFCFGTANDATYGPDFLLSEDNIVVTIQYRLGIFGFLNLGFGEYTGNMGLKDQQLALKWVYENIEHFYGNKNEILLFGESSGAACVGFQMLNEESRKYFNRAYLSGSSALSSYALSETNHLQQMKDFSKIDDDKHLIEYLKTENSETLAKSFLLRLGGGPPKTFWKPTIESPNAVNAFITKSPEEIYNSNAAPFMDVLFSFNSKESTYFNPQLVGKTNPIIKENVEESDSDLRFYDFNIKTHPKEYKECLEKLRQVFYRDTDNADEIERANVDLTSAIYIVERILKNVVLQINANNRKMIHENNQKNVFLFRFSVYTDLNNMKFKHPQINFNGAAHADDIAYMFHSHTFDKKKLYDRHLQEKDATYDIIMRMVKIITNFARTGNPSIENDTPFVPCKSPNQIFCQEISNNPKSSVTTNVKEQFHYDVWREIEQIYNNVKKSTKKQHYNSAALRCHL